MCGLQVREKDWCNVITAHHGDSAAYTWRLQNFTLGEHVLKPPKSKKRKADKYPEPEEQSPAPVTAVGMSQCGNYGLVGRASGTVDRYNMQSGLHRGSYTRYNSWGVLEQVLTVVLAGKQVVFLLALIWP